MLGGAAMLFAASMLATAPLRRTAALPGLRAVAHWTPIAIAVCIARWMGRADVAMAMVIGTSVALLSTVPGSVSATAAIGPAPPRYRRMWAFPLMAALICFLAGFGGALTWQHAAILLIEGIILLVLWQDRDLESPQAALDNGPLLIGAKMPELVRDAGVMVFGGLVLALAVAGARFATRGAVLFSLQPRNVTAGALASSVLSLALALPMAYLGRTQAARGRSWVPMTTQTGIVLLNLCLLLPILALWPYALALGHQPAQAALLAYPLPVWRIDTVVLVVLCVFFLPVAWGKWDMGREEGTLLVIAYFVYVIAVVVYSHG